MRGTWTAAIIGAIGVLAAVTTALQTHIALASAADPTTDTCALIVRKTGGGPEIERAVPNLSVIEMTRADESHIEIPPVPDHDLVGFVCDRPDFVPAANDYRVLKAGYTLWIRVPGREGKVVVSLVDGNVNLSMAGVHSITGDEDRRARERLNEFSGHFMKPIASMAAADPGPEPTQDVCGLVVRKPGSDTLETRPFPGLSVMAISRKGANFPAFPHLDGEPVGFCDRDTIVPASSDLVPLAAGIPLWIRVRERNQMVAMYMVGDKLRFASKPGSKISNDEIARITARLGRFKAYAIPPGPDTTWGWPAE